MIYVVSYTLRPSLLRNTSALSNELQKPGTRWAHHLNNTWLVATDETANELYERIRRFFLQTDSILITPFNPNGTYSGWLPQEAWDWIEEHKYR